MANNWNISPEVELLVRRRDKVCVYCCGGMKLHRHRRGCPGDKATWEHIDNIVSHRTKENVALSCHSCNSSKKAQKLGIWFQSPYCLKNQINRRTVAKVVKNFIRIHKMKC